MPRDPHFRPIYKTFRLFSREKVETFSPVWSVRWSDDLKAIEIKHGGTYGAWTVSTRNLDDVYRFTTHA
jgi:hypothetical protein